MNKLNLIGSRFGKLRVVGPAPNVGRFTAWQCVCDCGTTSVVPSGALRSGNTKTCGCGRRQVNNKNNLQHGMIRTYTYRAWVRMRVRCRDKDNPNYGRRGLTVCQQWEDFKTFLHDMGEAPVGRTLDRIDPNKGYAPDNCRWATQKEQSRNKRTTRYLEWRGQRKPFSDWADQFGISQWTIANRVRLGWTPDRIFADVPHASLATQQTA